MAKCISGLLCLATAVPVFAQQESAQYRTCDKNAKSQTDMNICARDEAIRAEAEMDRVYRSVLSQVATKRDAETEPQAAQKIEAAQKAWIAYRDAYLKAMYPADDNDYQRAYGSMGGLEYGLLRAKLARRQVIALRELMQRP